MLPIFQATVDRVSHPGEPSSVSLIPSTQLRNALEMRVSDTPQELDMSAWMGRTALELIGQGGLGCSFDQLVSDNKNDLAISLGSFLSVPFFLDCGRWGLLFTESVILVRPLQG